MKPSRVERLLGTEISASYLTDDVLGLTLDEIYKADSTHLFMKLALKILEIVNIRTQLLQSETTNFIFHGDYKYIDDGSTIETTYGHAKDGRDGLKRFGLGMITNHSMEYHYLQRPTLIMHQTKKPIEAMKKLQEIITFPDDVYYIADSALYSANNVKSMRPVLIILSLSQKTLY